MCSSDLGVARGDDLPTTYDDLATDVRVGAKILLDDGLLSVEVSRIAGARVEGRVLDGGTLTSHKGMNLPGLQVSAPALTEKDREDVAHVAGLGIDYLALSFVRRAEDLTELRELAASCQAMLVVGTSGLVQPAAQLPLIARDAGAVVIEVSPDPTEISAVAHIVCRGPAGTMLPALVMALTEGTRT